MRRAALGSCGATWCDCNVQTHGPTVWGTPCSVGNTIDQPISEHAYCMSIADCVNPAPEALILASCDIITESTVVCDVAYTPLVAVAPLASLHQPTHAERTIVGFDLVNGSLQGQPVLT